MYNPDGTISFNTYIEMQYDLFNEIGLAINGQSYVYDQDTGIQLKIKDKYIKASVNGEPIYTGKSDVAFEPGRNYSLINYLFGYYLTKAQNTEDGDILCGYTAHFIDDNPEKDKQRVVVKTIGRGDIASDYYYNIYLAYFDVIFRIAGYIPNLKNFDIYEEKK